MWPAMRHLVVLTLLLPVPVWAQSAYSVGTVPVGVAQGEFEFPLTRDFRLELGFLALSQGTFSDSNPFAYLSLLLPWFWLHYDGIRDLRLSASLQEAWLLGVGSTPSARQEAYALRARIQQPRGEAALYEMLQLDLLNLHVGGRDFVIFRPRFRVGFGLNLDQNRIHSLTLYQEAALRFSEADYTTHPFDYYRTIVGYTFTTRRGVFVTVALLGNLAQTPAGNGLVLFYGPFVSFAYRIVPAAPDRPPDPPEVEPR
jgi:hypothetical protein